MMSFLVKILIAIGAILSFFWFMNFNSAKDEEANFNVIRECINHINLGLHIHPHLEIVISGERQIIPANIGIESANCMRPVHTHDISGTLHIEWKRPRDFVLADFFKVWTRTFNQNQILDSVVDENHEIILTVNGEQSEEYENLIMKDGDRIVIMYQEKQK